MLEELFDKFLPVLIRIFELMGIIILTIGTVTAFIHYFRNYFGNKSFNVKNDFAKVMITAIDFKLAAEIIKTVIVKTKEELIVLAVIFVLRITMAFVLEKEISNEKKEN